MPIAIISDVHGNAVALESVVSEIDRSPIDRILCLGDVAGTGPEPVRSIEHLQRLECQVVMGNVDEAMLTSPAKSTSNTESDRMFTEIDAWCADQLSESHKSFIRTFESTATVQLPNGTRLLGYHGSPRSTTEKISVTTSEETLYEIFGSTETDILTGGHTHIPFLKRYRGALVLNPGSVGLPYIWDREVQRYRHPPWAEYAIVTETSTSVNVELRRCPIDVGDVIESARESGMPEPDRWIQGWHESQ